MIKVGEKIGSYKRVERKDLKEIFSNKKDFLLISEDEYSDDMTEQKLEEIGTHPNYDEENSWNDVEHAIKTFENVIFKELFDNKEIIMVKEGK